MALLVGGGALALLSQAQNIEAAKRLLGLERKPEPRQPSDDFRPPSAPLPPPLLLLIPALYRTGQVGSRTFPLPERHSLPASLNCNNWRLISPQKAPGW